MAFTGFIDGSAPPFIVLALAWTIMTALMTYSGYSVQREELWAKTKGWIAAYYLSS